MKNKFIIMLFTFCLVAMSFVAGCSNNKTPLHDGFKLEKISSTDCKLYSRYGIGVWILQSARIILKNNSHDFMLYRIVSHSNSNSNIYTSDYDFTTNLKSQNCLIDYNIGKVTLTVDFYLKNIAGIIYSVGNSFTCYTKGSENQINFYNDEKCTEKTDFSFKTENGEFKMLLNVNTTYM